MAKGTQAKIDITNKILNTFKDSFLNDKEIRIPVMENGEEVQIKITLTAAKENIAHGEENAFFSETSTVSNIAVPEKIEITETEKQNVQTLLNSLGL